MNLAFYLAEYRPERDQRSSVPGGPTKSIRGLTQALSRRGHRVIILAQGDDDTVATEDAVRVRVFRRPSSNVPFAVSRDLLDYLRRNPDSLDGIVLNGVFHPHLAPLAFVARRSRLPYLVSPFDPYHSMTFRHHRFRKIVYWHLIERRLLQASAGILVMIEGHATHLRARGINAPVLTVPTGMDFVSADAPAPREPEGETVRLGYLGRMDAWHKGLDLLLNGVAAVVDRFPGLRLTVTGTGPDEPSMKQLAARLGLSDVVSFTGADLRAPFEIISGWDALIAPSRFDGYPITVLEAMVARRPVIISTEAGLSEHVERAGCGLVIQPSVAGVADGIARLMGRRDEWPDMAAAGYAYVEEHFAWDTIARNAAGEIARLLGVVDQAAEAQAPNLEQTSCASESPGFVGALWRTAETMEASPQEDPSVSPRKN